jgi:hypothetical protein
VVIDDLINRCPRLLHACGEHLLAVHDVAIAEQNPPFADTRCLGAIATCHVHWYLAWLLQSF